MPDINGTLNVVIGFITVVLVLSLIVQSIQNVVKRLLRMKSRQAEQSLRLLFDYSLTEGATKYTENKYASPILGAIVRLVPGFGTGSEKEACPTALVEEVKRQVLEMGRKSFWGNAILDSVSKEDLTKILKEVENGARDTAAKAAIMNRVAEVEKWYDTVMPGLAERYERGMKWMAVLLSAIVVILLNADAISIYTSVASDPAVQKQLLALAEKRVADKNKNAEKKESPPMQDGPQRPNAANSNAGGGSSPAQNANAAGRSNAASANSTANNSDSANSGASSNSNSATARRTANSNTAATTEAEAKPKDEAKPNADAEDSKALEDAITETKDLYAQYQQFGFKPFNYAGIKKSLDDNFWRTILGWLVMTLLLSLGAPFWEDALESVFGLKNTLRGKAKSEEKKAQQPV